MSATWRGVNAELTTRGQGVINESGGRIWLSEGFRTRAEQESFYAAYLRGGALAAKPGTSQHEKGLAIDLACAAKDNALRASLCEKWGLVRTVPSELWHYEMSSARPPLPLSIPTPVVAANLVVQAPRTFGDTMKRTEIHFDLFNERGDGWFPTDITFENVVNVLVQGPYPGREDTGTWSNPYVQVNNKDGKLVIVVENNVPRRALDFIVWTAS